MEIGFIPEMDRKVTEDEAFKEEDYYCPRIGRNGNFIYTRRSCDVEHTRRFFEKYKNVRTQYDFQTSEMYKVMDYIQKNGSKEEMDFFLNEVNKMKK